MTRGRFLTSFTFGFLICQLGRKMAASGCRDYDTSVQTDVYRELGLTTSTEYTNYKW